MRQIKILDTTLRDGEQVPGAKLNLAEKVEISRQLVHMNVDMLEVGFAASSKGDFQAIKTIAKEVGSQSNTVITALGRAVKEDIDAIYESVKYANNPMIHIVLGTSAIHMQKKFNRSKEAILQMGVDAVKYAKSLMPQVQYSPEDATRSDFEYLWHTVEAVVKAGATVINIADTVGCAVPEEFGSLIARINHRLKNLDDQVLLSVHCHNDTGLATANTLAAIKNGADKVECTINGIGERAGNTALEEVVMGLKVHPHYYNACSQVKTEEITKTSRLVSGLMGLDVQVNKAITGENAFAHSSGIHQDGLLKSREVYEVISPEDVGAGHSEIVLTARSGKHAFKNTMGRLGFHNLETIDFDTVYSQFLDLADQKKEVYDVDVFYLIQNYIESKNSLETASNPLELIHFESYALVTSIPQPTVKVTIKKGLQIIEASSSGNGVVDALYLALEKATQMNIELQEYRINSISKGKDALGRARVLMQYRDEVYKAKAVDTDILKASALAYVNGVNQVILDSK
jgi:2-isopropylmalate synthase